MKLIIVSFVAIFVALIAIYILTRDNKERFEEKSPKSEVSEGAAKSVAPTVKVMLFYATWCPHCERYLETGKFDTFDAAVKGDASVKGSIAFSKIDYDKNQALGDRYGISAFPTIIAVDKDEKVYRFQGNREKPEHMVKFVKAVLEKRTLSSSDY